MLRVFTDPLFSMAKKKGKEKKKKTMLIPLEHI